jgi:tRNA 2-thiouridine synthesizing protein A
MSSIRGMLKWVGQIHVIVEQFEPTPTHQLDVLGFYCPVPLRTLQSQIIELENNEILLLIADDPETKYDIPPFLERSGHTLHQLIEHHGEFYFVIEVNS